MKPTDVTHLGTKLGPYEVQSPLGAGGMGEVYRARDVRLDRTVAVKVLASHLSSSPELKQRMEREARAISALNDPPHLPSLRYGVTGRNRLSGDGISRRRNAGGKTAQGGIAAV